MVLDLRQREQLVHPREHHELLGGEGGGATPIEQIGEVVAHRAPMGLCSN